MQKSVNLIVRITLGAKVIAMDAVTSIVMVPIAITFGGKSNGKK